MSVQLGNVWSVRSLWTSRNAHTAQCARLVSSWGVTAWCVHRRTRRQKRSRGVL